MSPQVGIVYGSPSDKDKMGHAAATLQRFGVEYEMEAMSAHRSPERVRDYAASAEDRSGPHPAVVIGPDVIGIPSGSRESPALGYGAGKDETPVVRAPVRLGVEHGEHGGHVLAARAAAPPQHPGEAAHPVALTPPRRGVSAGIPRRRPAAPPRRGRPRRRTGRP